MTDAENLKRLAAHYSHADGDFEKFGSVGDAVALEVSINSLHAAIDELIAERDALKADAARYGLASEPAPVQDSQALIYLPVNESTGEVCSQNSNYAIQFVSAKSS